MNADSGLKICFWGNQDNGGYRWCKWLRHKGWDAHLYMMENDNVRSFPESIDRELADGNYPEWIHVYRNNAFRTLFISSAIKKQIEDSFDIVVSSGAIAMMNSYSFDIPVINISTGPTNQGVLMMWDNISLPKRIKWAIGRFFIRKSVRKCKKILVHYDPELYSLSRLKQDGKMIFFGSPEDVAGNRDRVDTKLLAELDAKYSSYDKVFLWLGRIAFSNPKTAMYKGTDKFVEAVEKVVAAGRNIRVVIGSHGEDVALLKALVRAKGLSDHVEWVSHMEYWKLLTYMCIDNAVVVDELTEFNCVSSGMFRECLSVGGVLIRSYSPVLTGAGHGPHCPILHAVTAADVVAQMIKVLDWSSDEWNAQRNKSLAWAEQYLDQAKQVDRLADICEQVVYSYRVSKRLEKLYA